MNWYELATAAEVEEILEKVYRQHWDSELSWDLHGTNHYAHAVRFDVAEQLWADGVEWYD